MPGKKGLFLESLVVYEIYNELSDNDEMFPLLTMLEDNGLIVHREDGSMITKSGYIKSVEFEGMDSLTCKIVKLYLSEKTEAPEDKVVNESKLFAVLKREIMKLVNSV